MNITNSTITIGTSPVVVLPDRTGLNSKRQCFVLMNNSTGGQVITLAAGQQVTAGQGIVLNVGGSWDRQPNESPPQDMITGVASASGAVLTIYEEVLD